MQARHAATAGTSIGLLSGIVICTVINAPLSDLLYRSAILAVTGAWMGVLLVWLGELLSPSNSRKMSHGHRERRS